MRQSLDTKRTSVVEAETQAAYVAMFPSGDANFVSMALGWATDWFNGSYAGYQAIDTYYHDLEHTLQGLLCITRIFQSHHRLKLKPILQQRTVELGILAMLMHDTGYLKRRDDVSGTGGKYTFIHVDRSIVFAKNFLTSHHFSGQEILSVENMIRCTGINTNLSLISFESQSEEVAGTALGSADLLGQMAAPDYVDKLSDLYLEIAEGAHHTPDLVKADNAFSSADDLMRRTPEFWSKIVFPKLNLDFKGLYRVLNEPYPDGRNVYIDRINANITRVRNLCATSKHNKALS